MVNAILSWMLAGFCGAAPDATAMVEIADTRLTVRTSSVEAVFEGPALVGLRPAGQEVEFAAGSCPVTGVDLVYLDGTLVGTDKHQQVTVRRLSERAARIDVVGDDTRRSLLVIADPQTGDVRVTPDGLSARRGLRAVRWTAALHPEATGVLPCVNGLIVRSSAEPPIRHRFRWPFEWNAQLAIVERDGWSVMVHAEDRDERFKNLQVDAGDGQWMLGFESEPPGPLWDNRTAGGLEWRISAYRGSWREPASRYRRWLEAACGLAGRAGHRPAWTQRISLAVCWAGSDVHMLDALASVHPPQETLIHLSGWRTDPYDINYPQYRPSANALEYMRKAAETGFHVMPHFNYFAVDMKHPIMREVGDYQLRSLDRNSPEGWYWPPETFDYTRMAYIHPGLGLWRSRLIDAVLEACDALGTDVAFLDQTLCTWNTDNGLVQGLTTIGGLRQLQEEFAAVRPGLVLAGEGLNEVSFRRQAFAQAHIYSGWGRLDAGHVERACDLNAFLWSGYTRLIGYYHLTPGGEDFELGIQVYERMGALPTIVTGKPEDLLDPSPPVRRILDRARAVSRAGTTVPAGG